MPQCCLGGRNESRFSCQWIAPSFRSKSGVRGLVEGGSTREGIRDIIALQISPVIYCLPEVSKSLQKSLLSSTTPFTSTYSRYQHADSSQRCAIIEMPGILKNWTSPSIAPGSVHKTNTRASTGASRKIPRATSSIWPQTIGGSRADTRYRRQGTISTSRHSRPQSGRPQSSDRSYLSAAIMNTWKTQTQELREIIRSVENLRKRPTYSVSPLSSLNVS
jgi:hypothetical protein